MFKFDIVQRTLLLVLFSTEVIESHRISSHRISPYLISSHRISSYLVLDRFKTDRLTNSSLHTVKRLQHSEHIWFQQDKAVVDVKIQQKQD